MTFWDAVVNGLLNYGRFRGRATRREAGFWLAALIGVLLLAILIDGAVSARALGFAPFAPEAGRPLTVAVTLAALLPTLAVTARRLHDAGRSGWWLALLLVPFGALVVAWLATRPSLAGDNRWGSSVAGLYRT